MSILKVTEMNIPAGFVGAAVFVGLLAGCAQPVRPVTSGPRITTHASRPSSVCAKGDQPLIPSRYAVHAGDVIRITYEGAKGDPAVMNLGNPGLFGVSDNRQFRTLYFVFAGTFENRVLQDIAYGPSVIIAGTGLPYNIFHIRVPEVGPGSYVVKFDYSDSGTHSSYGPVKYSLCTRLTVS